MALSMFANQKGTVVVTAQNASGAARSFQGVPTVTNDHPEFATVANNPGFPDQLSVTGHAIGTCNVTVAANNEVGQPISGVLAIDVLDPATAPADHLTFAFAAGSPVNQ